MMHSSLHHRYTTLKGSACGPFRTTVTPARTRDLRQASTRCRAVHNAEGTGKPINLEYWKDKKGCDLQKSGLATEIRDEIITYGELVQAAYDNLGQDVSKPQQLGNALKPAEEFLSYLQGNYRLAVPPPTNGNGNGNGNGVKPAASTPDRYKLPAARSDGLSPLFEGLPGKAAGQDTDDRPWKRQMGLKGLMSLRMNLWRRICTTVPSLAINFIEGTSPLFDKGGLGRGRQPRGTFFGYVALSEPKTAVGVSSNGNGKTAGGQNEEGGRDVALVWRGTIFKEEWESNFCEDQLDVFTTYQSDIKIVPRARDVGVHAGFCDIYTRSVQNPRIQQYTKAGQDAPPPREVVHEWLWQLMKDYNITTITATGHSLGGGLATLCAFDVAQFVEDLWKNGVPKAWKTQKKPEVRLVSFAAPRAGNAEFVEQFHKLGIKALRVENKGDKVPDVPGIFVQGIAALVETIDLVFDGAARLDMTSLPITFCRRAYQLLCSFPLLDNFHRRDPNDPLLKDGTAGPNSRPKYEGLWGLPPLFGLHVWGFFHVGQVLKLEHSWAKVGPKVWQPLREPSKPEPPLLKDLGLGQVHNLELYIYLISLLTEDGPPAGLNAGQAATRNPLLLNKSDDILGEEKLPASWWTKDDKRGCKQIDGCWVYTEPQADSALLSDSKPQELPIKPLVTASSSGERSA